MNSRIKNVIYIFLPLVLGAIIGLLISTDSYKILAKPPLSPPGWLFPIMWSIIYLLMGISYYLLKKENNTDQDVDKVYYSQLIVNLLWSIIFFSFKLYFLSCLWILLLDILIIFMINNFLKRNKTSAYLNIPYFIWCLFATYLTIGIYVLN